MFSYTKYAIEVNVNIFVFGSNSVIFVEKEMRKSVVVKIFVMEIFSREFATDLIIKYST